MKKKNPTSPPLKPSKSKNFLSVVICKGRKGWPEKTIASIFSEMDRRTTEVLVSCGQDPRKERGVRSIFVASSVANEIRNAGALCAKGNYVLFLDDDVALAPGWNRYIREAMDRGVMAGFGTVFCADEYVFEGINENGLLLRRDICSAFPFDEKIGPGTIFSASEATDLSHKFRKASIPTEKLQYKVLHPSLRPTHTRRKTLGNSLGNGFVYARHRLWGQFALALLKTAGRIVVGSDNFSRGALATRFFALICGFLAYEES